MDIRRTNNKLTTYWVSIPIYEVRGGTKVDLAHQSFDFEDWGICSSKFIHKNDEFYLHITVKKKCRTHSYRYGCKMNCRAGDMVLLKLYI